MCPQAKLAHVDKLCTCSCPPTNKAVFGRRHLFGAPKRTCSNVTKQIATVKAACGSIAETDCTFKCAQVLPKFMDECQRTFMGAVSKLDQTLLRTLHKTCTTLPTRPMINAIASAKCPPAGVTGKASFRATLGARSTFAGGVYQFQRVKAAPTTVT